MHTSKIILVGYRATGKTTVGKRLAASLSFDFIDMDKVIEQRENSLISEMVKKHGWDYFRNKEKNLLDELVNSPDKLVIATGGGAILHQEIWPKVMAAGMVVWLVADTETICDRLGCDRKTSSQRPSLTGSGTMQEVAEVLSQREPLYKAGSHFVVNTVAKTREQISEIIFNKFQSFSG